MNKEAMKKSGQELQDFLAFRKRGYWVKNKKGKASYDRAKFKRGEQDGSETMSEMQSAAES